MDKRAMALAAGLMCLSWAAIIPVYLLLKKNKELKRRLEENGSTSKKTEPGEVPSEKRS